jgi:RNA polymerase sigma-70 factor (ECF subfamily)
LATPSDEELMERAAEGDMDAFEEVVRRNQREALSTAFHFVGDPQTAEDIAQEAFLRLLRSVESYRATASFRTYLYRIVANLCIDHHRKRRPTPVAEPDAASVRRGPAEKAAAEERSAKVRAAIRSLPARQRLALVLQHYQGLSYEEIAAAMDATPGAVDSLLVRARRHLRELLAELL